MREDFEFWAQEQAWAMLPYAIGAAAWLLIAGGLSLIGAFIMMIRLGADASPAAFGKWWSVFGVSVFAVGMVAFHGLRLIGTTFEFVTGTAW